VTVDEGASPRSVPSWARTSDRGWQIILRSRGVAPSLPTHRLLLSFNSEVVEVPCGMMVASSSRRAALILLLSGLAIPASAVGHAITHHHLEHPHGGEVNPGHHVLPGHPPVHGPAGLETDHSHRHSHSEFSATNTVPRRIPLRVLALISNDIRFDLPTQATERLVDVGAPPQASPGHQLLPRPRAPPTR